MDVLSQALTATRTGSPISYQLECHRPWGRTYPPLPGAGFHVILEGSAWLIPATGPPVPLSVGDVVLFPHGQEHAMADSPETPLLPMPYVPAVTQEIEQVSTTVGPDGPGHATTGTVMLCGMYRFVRERPHPLLAALPSMIHLPAQLGRHNRLRSTVELLADELQQDRPGSHVAIAALIDLLLVHLLRTWYQQAPETGWAAAITDPTVSAALDAIHTRPTQHWSVDALGALTGVSRAVFARRFKHLVGQGPATYLTWWRMTLASDLLRQTNAPIAAVARHVGYTSEFAFANAFKREFGAPPGRYRNHAVANTEPDPSPAQHTHPGP